MRVYWSALSKWANFASRNDNPQSKGGDGLEQKLRKPRPAGPHRLRAGGCTSATARLHVNKKLRSKGVLRRQNVPGNFRTGCRWAHAQPGAKQQTGPG